MMLCPCCPHSLFAVAIIVTWSYQISSFSNVFFLRFHFTTHSNLLSMFLTAVSGQILRFDLNIVYLLLGKFRSKNRCKQCDRLRVRVTLQDSTPKSHIAQFAYQQKFLNLHLPYETHSSLPHHNHHVSRVRQTRLLRFREVVISPIFVPRGKSSFYNSMLRAPLATR